MKTKPTILLTGGGTGGHVYPAMAIAESIADLAEIEYAGHPDKIEGQIVPDRGIPFHGIVSHPFPSSKLKLPGFGLKFIGSLRQGLKLLRKTKPALVIGVGGYVSMPVTIAARIRKIPVLLHEANVLPGKANRLMIKWGAPVMTTFQGSEKYIPKEQITRTGCPVRSSIGTVSREDGRRATSLPQDARVLLIVGGSGGASAINSLIVDLLPMLDADPLLHILHVTGRAYHETVVQMVSQKHGMQPDRYEIISYANNIEQLFAAADLIICRSGSSTINELLCAGLPAIMIPSPNVTDNHQEANARFIESVGAGKVVLEKELEVSKMEALLKDYFEHPEKLKAMSEAARQNCNGKVAGQKIRERIIRMLEQKK